MTIERCYIALGSNLGERASQLGGAIDALDAAASVEVIAVSSIYETAPVGPPQPDYLNAAAELRTSLAPRALLDLMLELERRGGRDRGAALVPCGPRAIDLDLLLFGELELDVRGLVVPHPRMHERGFVLRPLAEIAPDVVHPRLERSVAELLAQVSARESGGPGGRDDDCVQLYGPLVCRFASDNS